MILFITITFQYHNSPGDWARELFKPSKYLASLLVWIFFNGNFWIFLGWQHKWDRFKPFKSKLPGPGRNCLRQPVYIYTVPGFRPKTSSFQLAYQRHNSYTDCARELFKPSKVSASPLACTRRNFLVRVCGIFVSDVIIEAVFRPFWLRLPYFTDHKVQFKSFFSS